MHPLLLLYFIIVAALLVGAGKLHLMPRMGAICRRMSAAFCRAPLVDFAISYFTVAPPIAGAIVRGWAGLGVAVGAQITALLIWIAVHELAHPGARKGPRIYRTIDGNVGWWRNHLAVWWTAWATPLFWIVRMAEILIYPLLTWTVRLPKYKSGEWVNLSRQKFEGLVGYDLIWCLYCDWMTGVWSLGSEMLRNVESFWCPIRFYHAKKCDNCAIDFPDIENGWIAAEGSMQDVTALLQRKYENARAVNGWFGHPTRLTIEGNALDDRTPTLNRE